MDNQLCIIKSIADEEKLIYESGIKEKDSFSKSVLSFWSIGLVIQNPVSVLSALETCKRMGHLFMGSILPTMLAKNHLHSYCRCSEVRITEKYIRLSDKSQTE